MENENLKDVIRISVPRDVMADFEDRTEFDLEQCEGKPRDQLNIVLDSLFEEGIEIVPEDDIDEITVEEMVREEVIW